MSLARTRDFLRFAIQLCSTISPGARSGTSTCCLRSEGCKLDRAQATRRVHASDGVNQSPGFALRRFARLRCTPALRPCASQPLRRLRPGPSPAWLGRSPGRASTGPSPLSGSPLLRLRPGPSPAWLGRSPGRAFSPCSPAPLESSGQTIRGLPVRRGGDSRDQRPCSVSPTGPFAMFRFTHRKSVQQGKGSLDLSLYPLRPSRAAPHLHFAFLLARLE